MGAGTELKPRVRRVGVGIVELVPEAREDRSLRTLKDNLSNRLCAVLVMLIAAAQIADVATTYSALSSHAYIENNPVLRALIVRSPLAAYSVKLLVIFAIVLVALSRLHGRRAQFALALAAGLSLIAPLLNMNLLLGS
jgi:Domain of unknown function (DUF5658)